MCRGFLSVQIGGLHLEGGLYPVGSLPTHPLPVDRQTLLKILPSPAVGNKFFPGEKLNGDIKIAQYGLQVWGRPGATERIVKLQGRHRHRETD